MYLDRNSRDSEVEIVSQYQTVREAEQAVRDAVNQLQTSLEAFASHPEWIDRTTTVNWIASMYGRRIR